MVDFWKYRVLPIMNLVCCCVNKCFLQIPIFCETCWFIGRSERWIKPSWTQHSLSISVRFMCYIRLLFPQSIIMTRQMIPNRALIVMWMPFPRLTVHHPSHPFQIDHLPLHLRRPWQTRVLQSRPLELSPLRERSQKWHLLSPRRPLVPAPIPGMYLVCSKAEPDISYAISVTHPPKFWSPSQRKPHIILCVASFTEILVSHCLITGSSLIGVSANRNFALQLDVFGILYAVLSQLIASPQSYTVRHQVISGVAIRTF